MAGTAAFRPGVADGLVLSIVNDPAAARSDAHAGTFGRPVHVVASPAGLAFLVGRAATAYRWEDVRDLALRRHSVLVRTESLRETAVVRDGHRDVRRFVERKTRSFRLVVDEVEEESLSATFVRVLADMRAGTFAYDATAWHEYRNAIERLEHEFAYQDDHVLPAAASGLWVALGVLCAIVVSVAMNVAAARAVPPGAFTLSHRITAIDPRSLAAGFAASALLTGVVLRLGLGRQATVWIRGAARGWHHDPARGRHRVVQQVGRLLLSPPSAAGVLLLALLAFWPSVATTVLIDAHGVRDEVLLPFVSLDEPWRNAMQIERVPIGEPAGPAGVLIRFVDGRTVSTVGSDLGGGTEVQLYEVGQRWWKAAPR